MMMPIDKDAVLDAFAAESLHDRSTLDRYVREYPDLAEELIDLASELRFSAGFANTETGVISDPKRNTAWENFRKAGMASATVDPFAQFKGAAFAVLAGKLDLPRSILTAVRDRLVVPSSVPGGFVRRLAEATNTTIEIARTYMAQESQTPLSLEFKSDHKPSKQGQITFRQLIESTEMSESQRLHLLRECEEHELP
ncbi:MAG: hypothetical protein R3B84_09400 [Zavarzinella sp.]